MRLLMLFSFGIGNPDHGAEIEGEKWVFIFTLLCNIDDQMTKLM